MFQKFKSLFVYVHTNIKSIKKKKIKWWIQNKLFAQNTKFKFIEKNYDQIEPNRIFVSLWQTICSFIQIYSLFTCHENQNLFTKILSAALLFSIRNYSNWYKFFLFQSFVFIYLLLLLARCQLKLHLEKQPNGSVHFD